MRSPNGSTSIERLIFRVLIRGEFRLGSSIVLMTIYGASILVIPVVLSSVFSVSATYLGLIGNQAEQELILSIYSEVSSAYVFVEALLFIGFIITCALSGMAIGRKARTADTLLSHLGVEYGIRRRLMMLALLSLSLVTAALAFFLAVILSSASLYSMSILFAVPDTELSLGVNMLIYLLSLILAGYLSLVLGWTRTFRRQS
ncbi:MAG: hypothetical protein ACRECH_01535 [Nitrososphaerales archaeon]